MFKKIKLAEQHTNLVPSIRSYMRKRDPGNKVAQYTDLTVFHSS